QDEKAKIYSLETHELSNSFSQTEKLKYSGFPSAVIDISNEGEMNNMLLKNQKDPEFADEQKFLQGTTGIKSAAGEMDKQLLVKQDSAAANIFDAGSKELQSSGIRPVNEEGLVSKDVELLKNLLEKVDSIPQALFAKRADTSGGNYDQTEGIASAAAKSNSSSASEFDIDSMDEFVRSATEELKKLSNEEAILKRMLANEENAPLEAEFNNLKQGEAKKNPAFPGLRIFGGEPETAPFAAQMNLKSNLNKDYSGTGNGGDGKKSGQVQENAGKKEQTESVQDKSSTEKAAADQKTSEGFKNILHNSDALNNLNADRFKTAPEMKPLQESFKNIKATEIVNEFSKIIQSGEKQSMTFQLSPENLGKVKLIVDLVENQINTRIEVENENVKQFIQSNIEQLKQNLQLSGIHLSQLNISLSDSEQKSAKTFARKKSAEKISRVEEDKAKASPAQKTMGYNTYEFLA
ncbi:MAG: flagellar hook-length control protein FliK, partial [Melioribacteraceae bacterium]